MNINARMIITLPELMDKFGVYLPNAQAPIVDLERNCISIAYYNLLLDKVGEGEILPITYIRDIK